MSSSFDKTINLEKLGKSINFSIWDTPGTEKLRPITRLMFKKAKVIILVYDATYKKTFKSIKDYWYEDVIKNLDYKPIFFVVVNKIDLSGSRS